MTFLMNEKWEVRWKIEHVRHADTMTIFSVTRKESGSKMTIVVINGKRNRGSSGKKA